MRGEGVWRRTAKLRAMGKAVELASEREEATERNHPLPCSVMSSG